MLDVTATDRLDRLVADLAGRLGADPLPPHRDECIVVQSLSLRRWLQQRLAEHWGCAAGLDLPFPAGLIAGLEQDLGLATTDDPWHRDRLRWRIAALAERPSAGLEPLAAYLATGHPAARPAKRLQLADRLADLLDAYQIYRPEMLAAWESGGRWADAPDEDWQAELWRRLRADIPAEPRSRRLDALARHLRSEGPPPSWHLRLSVLATGVLPPRVVDVLEALAIHLPVGIWLTSPLPQPWGDVRTRREAARAGGAAQGHPLVASLGRQARDWFREIVRRPAWADGWRWLDAPDRPAHGLLGRLQAALGERGATVEPLDLDDRSMTFDCCHGPRREVEVARDRVLAACAELPGLRPHEILILAPDLTVYGPLVEAVFANADHAVRLPVRISDRTIGGADDVAEGLLAILALAQGRCGLGEVLDLLELPAVRAAAGLRPDQVAQAQDALVRAGLRWGRDAGHRRRLLGMEEVEDHGTLQAAVDRLMLGWAMGADAASGRPASGAEGAPDHELLGALLGWLQRMLAAVAGLAASRPLPAWCAQLHAVRLGLLAADGLDAVAVNEALDDLAGQAQGQPAEIAISLAEISAALTTALGAEARASDFVSGSITVAGLKPMRMVPARVIVLLGMADAAWPRRTAALPFDLLAAKPQIGDRQPREDDRQLFLEAILAAGERLIIAWPGRAAQGDPRHEHPPSACLAELFAAVDAAVAWGGDEADRPSARLTTVHPLQPFAAAYLAIDGRPALPSWDAGAIALARQLAVPVPDRPAEACFADHQEIAVDRWRIDELVRLWQDPAAAWCRHRLGASPQDAAEVAGDYEPFSLDALERYRLVDRLLASPDRQAALERAMADGQLPLGRLGDVGRERLLADLTAIDAVMAPHRSCQPLVLELDGDAWRLEGVLDPAPAGNVLRQAYAGAKPSERSRIALAIRLLAWNAWQEDRAEAAGCGELVARDARERLPAHAGDARQRLDELLQLSTEALASPLPFFPRTGWKLHQQRGKRPDELLYLAERTWQGGGGQRGECDQPAVALAWRGLEAITPDSVELMLRVWGLLIAADPAGRR